MKSYILLTKKFNDKWKSFIVSNEMNEICYKEFHKDEDIKKANLNIIKEFLEIVKADKKNENKKVLYVPLYEFSNADVYNYARYKRTEYGKELNDEIVNLYKKCYLMMEALKKEIEIFYTEFIIYKDFEFFYKILKEYNVNNLIMLSKNINNSNKSLYEKEQLSFIYDEEEVNPIKEVEWKINNLDNRNLNQIMICKLLKEVLYYLGIRSKIDENSKLKVTIDTVLYREYGDSDYLVNRYKIQGYYIKEKNTYLYLEFYGDFYNKLLHDNYDNMAIKILLHKDINNIDYEDKDNVEIKIDKYISDGLISNVINNTEKEF